MSASKAGRIIVTEMGIRTGCFNVHITAPNTSVYPKNPDIIGLFIRNNGPQSCKVAWGTTADQGVTIQSGQNPFYWLEGQTPTEELFATSTDATLEIVITYRTAEPSS